MTMAVIIAAMVEAIMILMTGTIEMIMTGIVTETDKKGSVWKGKEIALKMKEEGLKKKEDAVRKKPIKGQCHLQYIPHLSVKNVVLQVFLQVKESAQLKKDARAVRI
jgi:hypothetical protein